MLHRVHVIRKFIGDEPAGFLAGELQLSDHVGPRLFDDETRGVEFHWRRDPMLFAAHAAAPPGKNTLKQAPSCHAPRPTSSRPLICLTSDWTILSPNPWRLPGWNPSGRLGPPFDTERQWPCSREVSTRTVILPLPCFAALVISSLTTRPIGAPSVVGISIGVPSTTIGRGASPSNSTPEMSAQSCATYCLSSTVSRASRRCS